VNNVVGHHLQAHRAGGVVVGRGQGGNDAIGLLVFVAPEGRSGQSYKAGYSDF